MRVSGHLTAFYGLSAADAVGETDTKSVDLVTETIDDTRTFVARVFMGSNRGSVWGYFGFHFLARRCASAICSGTRFRYGALVWVWMVLLCSLSGIVAVWIGWPFFKHLWN